MNAEIVLKCDGRCDNGFVFCNGTENIILDLSNIAAKENYLTLMEYLFKTVEIFNKPCVNVNVIINAIYKIYELGFISEKLYNLILNYYNFHKRCGIILLAKPKGENK